MNKGQQFWKDMWIEGRIPFHLQAVNPDLTNHWPKMNMKPSASVLVPLCGKSLDLMWLYQQGYKVIGIEMSEIAVLQFAEEQQLIFDKEIVGSAIRYFIDSMELWVGDIFEIPQPLIQPVDAIYDRAALIALPDHLRFPYVNKCLGWLKSTGAILLKTKVYPQDEMQGPPFSVSEAEVADLFKGLSEINTVVRSFHQCGPTDPLYGRGLKDFEDVVWIMRRSK